MKEEKDSIDKKYLNCKEMSDYVRLQEKYDFLRSSHDAVIEETLKYENEIEKLQEKLQSNTHKICEKIREQLVYYMGGKQGYESGMELDLYLEVHIREFVEFIDKIENVEEN